MTNLRTAQDLDLAKQTIEKTISSLELNLSGLKVLTEVGSGDFVLTPLIAQLANAEKVYAWTADSPFGQGDDIVASCIEMQGKFGLSQDVEFAVNERPADHVAEADIITNSGFVRPLDRDLFSSVAKENVAVPLMYEKWEWRASEVDLDICREKSIKVAGTWENYGSLRVFDYCGALALKMCFEAGQEIFGTKIVVWSDDPFGSVVSNAFRDTGADEVVQIKSASGFYEQIPDASLAFFCDYHESRNFFGDGGIIDVDRLKEINPRLKIVHLFGAIDPADLKQRDIGVYPDKVGYPQRMTFTLSYLGITPLIKLQVAGLKVGQCLVRRTSHPICQPIN